VDTSDHEVNIKILLDLLLRTGVITSRADRNRLLAAMTDEVSDLVLVDNADQSLALSLDGIRSARAYEAFVDLAQDLVSAAILDRADDAVPTREELLGLPSRDRGLPRPLLCVMLGHVKNWAFARALDSSLPDAEIAQPFLVSYFPSQMREAYRNRFGLHPLKREIVATATVNYLVNRAGVGFIQRVRAAADDRDVGDIVHAYLLADRESRAEEARTHVLAAGRKAADEQAQLVEIEDALERATLGLLRKEHVDFGAVLNGVRGAV
jgi:glutamate dehydrogenase